MPGDGPGWSAIVQEWNQPDMPDSPARPGPPLPPGLIDTPKPTPTERTAPRGPYGLPFPRPSVNPPRRNRPEAPRQDILVPQPPEEPVGAGETPGRPDPVRPPSPLAQATDTTTTGIVRIALVVALVIGALWADRGRHEPVAGYGVIPQPGATAEAIPLAALAVGAQAPNFRLPGADGEIVELAGLRGQPTVLHFWTTWCLTCADDLPVMQDLAERSDDVQVLGIDVGEPAGRVSAAADRHGVTYPMALDRDESVARAFGVVDYPATILVGADGVITSIQAGPVTSDALREQVDALVGGQ